MASTVPSVYTRYCPHIRVGHHVHILCVTLQSVVITIPRLAPLLRRDVAVRLHRKVLRVRALDKRTLT